MPRLVAKDRCTVIVPGTQRHSQDTVMRHDEARRLEPEPRQDTQMSRLSQDRERKTMSRDGLETRLVSRESITAALAIHTAPTGATTIEASSLHSILSSQPLITVGASVPVDLSISCSLENGPSTQSYLRLCTAAH